MKRWLQLSAFIVAVFGLVPCCTNLQDRARQAEQDQARQEAAAQLALRRFAGLAVTVLPSGFAEPMAAVSDTRMASRQAPLREVMFTLFKDSGVNLLIDADVDGEASFDIKNSSAEATFEALLRMYDLAYHWDGNFLRIARNDQRTFDIDFPLPSSAGQGGAGGGGSSSGSNSGGSSGGSPVSGGASETSASVWDTLERDLQTLVGTQGQRLIVNSTLGAVMVEARPSTIRRVGDYVQTLRRRATRQVSIEARVLEVTLNDAFRAGLDLSVLPHAFNASTSPLASGATIDLRNAAGVGTFNLGITDPGEFSLVVDALEQQGQVRVLSSPRISTLNNMVARIRVVEQVPIIEREVIDSGIGSRTEFSVRFTEAGVAVDVTPQISEDGTITCRIRPSITEVSGFVETPDRLIREPILNTRSLNTTLRVRDGQPIVLGGLRGKRSNEDLDKVPLLGDIPVLGALFRKTSQAVSETELVIVMMPRILTPAWEAEDVVRGTERVVQLRRDYALGPLRRLSESFGEWFGGVLGGAAARGEDSVQAMPPGKPQEAVASAPTLSRKTLAAASFRRALAALRQNERSEGTRRIQEALALDPEHADALLLRGILALRDGQPEQARQALQASLRCIGAGQAGKDGKSVSVQSNLGLAQLRAGNPFAAREVLERALLTESTPEIRNNLGIALMVSGQLDDAVRELERALVDRPEMVEARLNLAICLRRLGRTNDARIQVEQFQQAGGSLDDARLHGVRPWLLQLLGRDSDEPRRLSEL